MAPRIWVRFATVTIAAEGTGGHTALALVQYNDGPGYVERVRITGFDTGLEISDGWGESFTFNDITVENQNAGGAAVAIADKLIAIENLTVRERHADVTGIRLFDDKGRNSAFGGSPHLTLLNAEIANTHTGGARVHAINVEAGHVYLRNVVTRGYGSALMLDHGLERKFVTVPSMASLSRFTARASERSRTSRSPLEMRPHGPSDCPFA